jgi:glucose-1-phosphate thymidylyltransferase
VEISNGLVVGLEEKPEKPKTDLALIGLYYFTEAGGLRKALSELIASGKTTRGEVQLTDALAIMLAGGERFVPQEVSDWYDCGKKETLIASNRHLLRQAGGSPEIDGSVVMPPVYVAQDAVIESSVIGPHVSIGAGARVNSSVISDSIIGEGAGIQNAVLTESIVGPETAVFGARRRLNIGKKSEVELG